jgi:hypothetical protein
VVLDWNIAANPIRKVAIESTVRPKGIIEAACSALSSGISHPAHNRAKILVFETVSHGSVFGRRTRCFGLKSLQLLLLLLRS